MSKPPKIDRKSLRNPDEFVRTGQALLSRVQGGRNSLLIGLAGVLVLIFGFYGTNWWTEKKLDKAWKAYVEAEKQPEDKKWESLKGLPSQFGSNRATFMAQVALADHSFDEAKKAVLKNSPAGASIDEAVTWYSKALEFSSLELTEKQLLYINRGSAYEVASKLDQAQSDFQRAFDMEGHAKGYALLSLARIYELKNDTSKALETYSKVATDYADSEFGKQAKVAERRLKGALYKDAPKS